MATHCKLINDGNSVFRSTSRNSIRIAWSWTWIVAIASTAPEAPSRCPSIDLVELIFNCRKRKNNKCFCEIRCVSTPKNIYQLSWEQTSTSDSALLKWDQNQNLTDHGLIKSGTLVHACSKDSPNHGLHFTCWHYQVISSCNNLTKMALALQSEDCNHISRLFLPYLWISSKWTHESLIFLEITSYCWGRMGIHIIDIMSIYSCLRKSLIYTK